MEHKRYLGFDSSQGPVSIPNVVDAIQSNFQEIWYASLNMGWQIPENIKSHIWRLRVQMEEGEPDGFPQSIYSLSSSS